MIIFPFSFKLGAKGGDIMQTFSIKNELIDTNKKGTRVFANDDVHILNVQMRAGESIPTHNAPGTVIVTVRSGTVLFNVEGVDTTLSTNDILVMDPLENHSLTAVTDVDIIVTKLQK